MTNFKLILAYTIKWISIAPVLTGLFMANFQIGDSFDYESFVLGWGVVILGVSLFLSGNSWAKSQNGGVSVSKSMRLLIIALFFISGLIFVSSWRHQNTLQENFHSPRLPDLYWDSGWDWIYDLLKFDQS